MLKHNGLVEWTICLAGTGGEPTSIIATGSEWPISVHGIVRNKDKDANYAVVDRVTRDLHVLTSSGDEELDYTVIMPEYAPSNQLFIELQQMPGTESYIFEIVADDLRFAVDILPSRQGSTKAILDRLKKWKDFFATGKLPVLSEIKAQGLFGELLFLKELITEMGINAVNYWSGINNETHDFYIGQNAVEIKTTSTQAPYMAHVNSEYQLDDHDVNGKLFLRMYAFRKDKNGGQRLPNLIEEIRNMLSDDLFARNCFDGKLGKAGYLDVAADYYQDGYTIRDAYSFEVRNGFPRINKESVPNGIYNMEYSVAIAQCMDFAIEAKDLIKGIKG